MATDELDPIGRLLDLRSDLDEEVRWSEPSDLGRMSIETMVARADGDVRSERSTGDLRLHGPAVVGHAVDLAAAGAVATAWQRLVNAVGAALEGAKGLRGRIPFDIQERCALSLNARPLLGSVVLSLEAKSDPLPEIRPDDTPQMFDAERPLVDRANEVLIALCADLATADLDDLEAITVRLQGLGPRVGANLRTLAEVTATANIGLDMDWFEPEHASRRSSWTVSQAAWIRQFVMGRALDAERVTLTGIAKTVSDQEKWLVEVDEVGVHLAVGELTIEEIRRVRPGDTISMLVWESAREQPDGTIRVSRRAESLVQVQPMSSQERPVAPPSASVVEPPECGPGGRGRAGCLLYRGTAAECGARAPGLTDEAETLAADPRLISWLRRVRDSRRRR